MIATLLDDVDFNVELRAHQQTRIKDRTEGRHLSSIIHYIVERWEPQRFGGKGPIDPALAQGGFIWEDVWSRVMAQTLGRGRQMEIEAPGHKGRPIYMTLDDFDVKAWRPVEFKMTKMSAANPIQSQKFRHWHMQLMSYTLNMGAEEALLVPLFLNGSYELGGGRFGNPVVGKDGHPYLMKYTERELQENWRFIVMIDGEMYEEGL